MNDRHTQNGASPSTDEVLQAQLTAYALGQLEEDERAQVEQRLSETGSAEMRSQVERTRRLAAAVNESRETDGLVASAELRSTVLECLSGGATAMDKTTSNTAVQPAKKPLQKRSRWVAIALVGGVLSLLIAVLALPSLRDRLAGRQVATATGDAVHVSSKTYATRSAPTTGPSGPPAATEPAPANLSVLNAQPEDTTALTDNHYSEYARNRPASGSRPQLLGERLVEQREAEAAPLGIDSLATASDPNSATPAPTTPTPFGVSRAATPAAAGRNLRQLHEGAEVEGRFYYKESKGTAAYGLELYGDHDGTANDFAIVNSEQYDAIVENAFLTPMQQPLSTFSIDVDTASYANVRRFLTSGRLPPPSAVRIEELVNYFSYDYPQPQGDDPFSVNMEMAECPWHDGHRLLRVGLKGKEIHRGERPESNLVFLLDVSGSMDEPNKLPLVKQSMTMLVQELTENDRVSIVTYAGNAGLVLPPTSGDQKRKILDAIESLAPGGSTHGSAGIQLAYEMAGEYFRKGGTNRVILATDGDLNVGVTSDEALIELIKEKAKGGTFLTVLGFGEGNLKDSKMEKLADNGNGIYAYIDGAREGRKVLVEQMTGSLITIAKDVKIQIEFNPAEVASYRLLGYENRVLAAQDFNDDKKDAGEIGAGHTVTALYEIVPVGVATEKGKEEKTPTTDPLKYQATGEPKSNDEATAEDSRTHAPAPQLTDAAKNGELLTLKLRYKQPDGDTSKLLEYPLSEKGGSFNSASKEMQFASAVVSFGMLLRQSEHRGTSNIAAVEEIASGSLGKDVGGYRAEFVDLVKQAASLGVK